MTYKNRVKLLFPYELNTLALGVEQRISVGWICVRSSTTVPQQPESQRWPGGDSAAWVGGCLGATTDEDWSQKSLLLSLNIIQSTQNRAVSLWLMTGPLSRLPPKPFFSHRGGAQPASQWQLWLLLHSWWKNMKTKTISINQPTQVQVVTLKNPLPKWKWKGNTVNAYYTVGILNCILDCFWCFLTLTPCPLHLLLHSSALRKDALRHSPLKQICWEEGKSSKCDSRKKGKLCTQCKK